MEPTWTPEDAEKVYQEGRKFFEKHKNEKNYYVNWPYEDIGWQRSRFADGISDAEDEYIKQITKNFKDELEILCKRYEVNLSTGCGCCGGASINDNGIWREFSV